MGAQARFSGQGEKGKKKRRNANISQSMVCSVSKYLGGNRYQSQRQQKSTEKEERDSRPNPQPDKPFKQKQVI